MSSGFLALNNANLILIDDTYANYQIYSEGVAVTRTNDGYNGLAQSHAIITAPPNSLIVIRPQVFSTEAYWNVIRRVTPNNTVFDVWCYYKWREYSTSFYKTQEFFDRVFNYRVLTVASNLPVATKGYGLQIYDSLGNSNFSTQNKPGVFTQTSFVDCSSPGLDWPASVNIAYNSLYGKPYWVEMSSLNYAGDGFIDYMGLGGYIFEYTLGLLFLSDTVVSVARMTSSLSELGAGGSGGGGISQDCARFIAFLEG